MAKVPNSAKAIVKSFLDQYGLGGLINWAWDTYRQVGGGQLGLATLTEELPNQALFKQRFPTYEAMAKKGMNVSVQDIINYENSARQTFHAAGLPDGFYDSNAELGQFMLNNVSINELQARVKDAQQAMISSAPDVLAQLQSYYGIDKGHLTAFFLDPNKAEPILAQKYTAAQIGAQAGRAGMGLNEQTAMGLVKQGVTDAQAQQGFQHLGLEQGLFQSQVMGEQAIGQQEQLAAEFGGPGSTAAQLAFQQRQAQRKAQFQEDTGFNVTSQGVAGLAPTRRAV